MSMMDQWKFYVHDGSMKILCPRWIKGNFMSMMDQQKLCISGNSIFGKNKAKYLMSKMDQRKHTYWQNQNKIFYVYDGSMEIECISKNKAKRFMSMMDQRKMCTLIKVSMILQQISYI